MNAETDTIDMILLLGTLEKRVKIAQERRWRSGRSHGGSLRKGIGVDLSHSDTFMLVRQFWKMEQRDENNRRSRGRAK